MDTTEIALTEFADLDADELHLVKRGATGFPALLAKSVAAEIEAARSPVEKPRKSKLPKYVRRQIQAAQRRPSSSDSQEITTVKRSKLEQTAKRSLSKSVRQIYALRKSEAAAKSVENAVMTRIGQLEKQLAKSSGQDSWSVAYLLNRERSRLSRFAKGVPDVDDFDAVAGYLGAGGGAEARIQEHIGGNPAGTGAAASRAGTARAISTAQGAPINRTRRADYDALRGVLDDAGQPESLETFEVQMRKLEKALADAQTPSERESLGYQVTRRKLLAMHARGEG